MNVAIDSSRYIDLCRGVSEVLQTIQSFEKIFMPFIVLGKLRGGFLHGTQAMRNGQLLTRFLNDNRVEVLYADEQTTHHYARLYSQLKKQGTLIPQNDLWIAALVSQHDLYLFTRDKHFDALPQLARI